MMIRSDCNDPGLQLATISSLLRSETPANLVSAVMALTTRAEGESRAGISGVEIDCGPLGRWSAGSHGTPLIDGDLCHDGRELGRLQIFGREEFPLGRGVSEAAPLILMAASRIVAIHDAERRAVQDGLTGVLNRNALEQHLQQEIARARRTKTPLSVMVLDVDSLKKVNDECGHAIGDRMLTVLASVLKKTLRSMDMVIRYGGDEFVILLPDTDADAAEQVAVRLRERIKVTAMAPSVSIGIGELRDTDSGRELIDRADQRMYQEKQSLKKRINAA